MSKIEQLIKQRRDEAAEKQIPQKTRAVVKFLGRKIISQGEYALEEWEMMNEEIFEADEQTRLMGWLFQAYNFGKEFEIQYLTDREFLKVTWYGDTVYCEADGQAVSYVPGEWEKFLDEMYDLAFPKEEKYNKEVKEEEGIAFNKKVEAILSNLQKNWGLSF